MADNLDLIPLTRFERVAAYATLTDPDLLVHCHAAKRQEVGHEFVLICLTGILFIVVWTTTMMSGGIPWWAALPISVLVAGIIVMFDIRMAASDTEPRGVLRNGPLSASFRRRIAARLIVTFLLNSTTALGMDMFVMHDEAFKAMAQDVDAKNAPVRLEYDQSITTLKTENIEPEEKHLADLTAQSESLSARRAKADADRIDAFNAAQAQDLESEQQDHGIRDRRHGHGDLAIDAGKQHDLALARMNVLTAEKSALLGEQATVQGQIVNARGNLATARAQFGIEATSLLRERDSRLLHLTNSPLTIVLGWLKLEADPQTGAAVRLTTFVLWLTMSVLELAFFLIRVVFKDAQIYDLRITTRARHDAVNLGADFAAHVRETRRRMPLRVVADNEASPQADAGQEAPQANADER